jgi:cytochrome b561
MERRGQARTNGRVSVAELTAPRSAATVVRLAPEFCTTRPMLRNTPTRYGLVSKSLHWAVFALVVYQFVSGNLMSRLGRSGTVLGLNQDHFYNWHKSIGLMVLGLAVLRIIWRHATPLPEWAVALTPAERTITRRLEAMLYALMFLVPITGYLYVMTGGYGVRLFGSWDLPNPTGKMPGLATWMWAAHIALTYALVVVASWHVGLGLKKHVYEGTRFLRRMVPFGRE